MAIKKKQQEVSVIRRATQALREEVLGRPDGAFLGSESTLMSLLGVSRPTFRQAAKLVEQEQLLTIRRGVGGGFFARQPSTRGVAHVAAVYLLSRKATMEDAIRAARPLFAQTARLGARRRDPVLNARLAAFLVQHEKDDESGTDVRDFLRSEREFLEIFASLSGNPVLQLYVAVLIDFAGTFVATNVYARHPSRMTAYRAIRRSLIQTIINGDEQVAKLMSQRRSDAIIGWMEADIGVASPRINAEKRGKLANFKLIGLGGDTQSQRKSDGDSSALETRN